MRQRGGSRGKGMCCAVPYLDDAVEVKSMCALIQ